MGLRTWEVREHQETNTPNEYKTPSKSILSKKKKISVKKVGENKNYDYFTL